VRTAHHAGLKGDFNMVTFAIHSPFRAWKNGDYPGVPFVCLSLGSFSRDNDETILLSPQLMTEQEIDVFVDQTKDELEEFRKQAKKEIKSLRERIQQA
jgi:hypothetical protein